MSKAASSLSTYPTVSRSESAHRSTRVCRMIQPLSRQDKIIKSSINNLSPPAANLRRAGDWKPTRSVRLTYERRRASTSCTGTPTVGQFPLFEPDRKNFRAATGSANLFAFGTSILPNGSTTTAREPLGMAFATNYCATIGVEKGSSIRKIPGCKLYRRSFLRMSDSPRSFFSTAMLDETAI